MLKQKCRCAEDYELLQSVEENTTGAHTRERLIDHAAGI